MAFVHKSVSIKKKNGDRINNERLEYLGDAILGAIVADYLFAKFPEGDEGFMTKLRSRIVKRKNLNQVAEHMGIPRMMKNAPHLEQRSMHLYGNALEALIGAIYLDRGYRKARAFVTRKVMKQFMDLNKLAGKDSDYKSRLIEWAQKYKKEIVFETSEAHRANNRKPAFIALVKLDEDKLGTGTGGSKKEAEQLAAKMALSSLKDS